MKKNLFLMALAAVAMLATSCQKENDNGTERTPDTRLRVRIANTGVKSRAIGDPAQTNQITLTNGIIFVMNANGDVTYKEAVNTTDIVDQSGGQVLKQQVAKTDKVYIVANLTDALTTKLTAATNLTLAEINAELSSINSEVGTDYKKATLANSDAQSAAITADQNNPTATVKVSIAPVYSRIELVSVEGSAGMGNELTSFDVTGVYVTDYHMQYTLGGLFGGSIYEQKQSTDFTGIDAAMKNEAAWNSTNTSGIVVIPETGKSWVYNVPAGGLPRLIVRLSNIAGKKSGTALNTSTVYYLSLTGYSKNNAPILRMERAKVYRLNRIAFDLNQIAVKPNEDQVSLTVQVEVVDWDIEVVDGEL